LCLSQQQLGTAAAVNPNNQLPDAYVMQSGKGFSGPTAIQDSIDNPNTLEGYKVYLHQVTIPNK